MKSVAILGERRYPVPIIANAGIPGHSPTALCKNARPQTTPDGD